MIVEARVHPGARESRVVHDGVLEVWIKERAERGNANRALVQLVAKHFSVPASHVRLLRGHSARKKLLEVDI